MKIIGIIFARGNSKGIKNKNLLKFKKTTLLGNAIRQAYASKYLDRVIVSTESNKIAKEALKNNAEVPFKRPKILASDSSAEVKSWRHAIKFLNKNKDIDYVAVIPTTAPLRSISDINKCINLAIKKKLDFVFSVTKSSKNPYFNILAEKNKKLNLVCESKNFFSRRQDAPQCYDLTTVCYVFKPDYIKKRKNLFSGKTGFVLIPKKRSIDIDDKLDYKVANFLSIKND